MPVPALDGVTHFTVAHSGSQGDADNPNTLPLPMHRLGWEAVEML